MIATGIRLRWKESRRRRAALAPLFRWLAVAVVAAAVGQGASADEAGRYPPAQPLGGWDDRPAASSPDESDSHWPDAAQPAAAPGLLPARYQSQPAEAGGADGTPAPDGAAGPRPLPLTPQEDGAASPFAGFPGAASPQLINAATSLGIVVGLFLLVSWAMRGMPKGSGILPSEAVEVLGRAPLAGRQQVQLVRCGNKIVLLSVTPGGAQTLAEISDPAEVDRLHSICQPPNRLGGSLRQFFGGIRGGSRSHDDYPSDEREEVDFRHLEMGGHRHA